MPLPYPSCLVPARAQSASFEGGHNLCEARKIAMSSQANAYKTGHVLHLRRSRCHRGPSSGPRAPYRRKPCKIAGGDSQDAVRSVWVCYHQDGKRSGLSLHWPAEPWNEETERGALSAIAPMTLQDHTSRLSDLNAFTLRSVRMSLAHAS